MVMSAFVSLSLLGCGGATEVEDRLEDEGTVSQLATCDTLPTCESIFLKTCKPLGAKVDCCFEGGSLSHCLCFSRTGSSAGTWACD
ncbi:hypothetical protein D7V97_24805 [Corallococcus sp. CA053C]|nr:hypothetical protein D7V97_24805 [Corallococcus sp. CA053C]